MTRTESKIGAFARSVGGWDKGGRERLVKKLSLLLHREQPTPQLTSQVCLGGSCEFTTEKNFFFYGKSDCKFVNVSSMNVRGHLNMVCCYVI